MAQLNTVEQFIDPAVTIQTVSPVKRFKHQDAALKFALSESGRVLYSGMSTGKTFIALQYMEQFSGLRIIVAPAKPRYVFQEDYENFYLKHGVKPFDLYIPKMTAKKTDAFIRSLSSGVVVLSYEIACMLPLNEYPITAMVCDEVHRLGIYNSKQSITLAKLCRNVPNKMCMTGTAFHDAYERLYGVLRWLDPIMPTNSRAYPQARIFGHYDNFLAQFCNTYTLNHSIQIIQSYKNLNQLADKIRSKILMIKTTDVVDLPELVVKEYKYTLPVSVRDAYDNLEREGLLESDLADGEIILAPHVLTRMLRSQQLICSGELETEVGNVILFDITERLNVLKELIEQAGQEPLIIFTRFVRETQFIKALLPVGTVSMLTGHEDTFDDWKAGKTQYLIANVASGSEGVRMDRAHHLIFWSLGYSLKEYAQAVMRIRRNTNKAATCFVHCIVAENTIDQQIYARLSRKMNDVLALEKLL